MHILCATDFSRAATAAADVAAAIAKKMKLPLRLVHCAQTPVMMGELPVVPMDDTLFREELKKESDRLRTKGVEVSEELRHGNASHEIIAAATEQPARMVVLGSYGKGMAERWLIGSVAERVAEAVPTPALVVREADLLLTWLAGESTLRLLCGVDFSAPADAAIVAVKVLAGLGQVEIEAAYVRSADDPMTSGDARSIRGREVSERMKELLGDVPVTVHVRDVTTQPAVEFLHTADEQRSALLVVGTHQRHGLRRLAEPSFSRGVLAHAATNVLCVPSAAGAQETRVPSIRRVLVAMDLTEPCAETIRHARSLLPSGGALRFIHVCHEPSRGINPVIASEVYFDHSLATARARKEAEEKLNSLPRALMCAPGIAITSEVLTHHDIAVAICDAASRFGADVICMGTKGRSRTGVAFLGSTVQAVLARAHKPVFVVTPPLE